MTHLIDKDALVAWAKETYLSENASMIRKVCYKQLLEHLDTLKVKEVDLEKEYKDFVEEDPVYNKLVNGIVGKAIAKHFFELGMAVSSKAQKGEKVC